MYLISLTSLKSFMQIPDTLSDALLEDFIEWNSQLIERYLNRDLLEASYTKKFTVGDGRRIFGLSAYPIKSSLVSVSVVDYTSTLTEGTDFWVDDDDGTIEFFVAPTYIQPQQLKVAWYGGYTTSVVSGATASVSVITVPDDIKYATILQASFAFRKRDSLGMLQSSGPDGSIAVQINPPSLLPEVRRLLDSHRRRNVI